MPAADSAAPETEISAGAPTGVSDALPHEPLGGECRAVVSNTFDVAVSAGSGSVKEYSHVEASS